MKTFQNIKIIFQKLASSTDIASHILPDRHFKKKKNIYTRYKLKTVKPCTNDRKKSEAEFFLISK